MLPRADLQSQQPALGTNIFNSDIFSGQFNDTKSGNGTPYYLDQEEYVRFTKNPNGNYFLMGNFYGGATDLTAVTLASDSFFPAPITPPVESNPPYCWSGGIYYFNGDSSHGPCCGSGTDFTAGLCAPYCWNGGIYHFNGDFNHGPCCGNGTNYKIGSC